MSDLEAPAFVEGRRYWYYAWRGGSNGRESMIGNEVTYTDGGKDFQLTHWHRHLAMREKGVCIIEFIMEIDLSEFVAMRDYSIEVNHGAKVPNIVKLAPRPEGEPQ